MFFIAFLFCDAILIFLFAFFSAFYVANAMETIITIIFVISVIKIFLQDIIMGLFKARKNILLILFYIIIDVIRVLAFLYCLNEHSIAYSNSGAGLSFLGSLLNITLFFIIGGIIFLWGEFISISHGMKRESLNGALVSPVLGDIAALIFLIGFCWFALS